MTLRDVATVWGGWKTAVEDALNLSSDALHVHVGMLLLLAFAVLTRRGLHQWLPWLLLLTVECANEYVDLHQRVGSIESNWPASRHDIFNTMFVPTILLLVLRWRGRCPGN